MAEVSSRTPKAKSSETLPLQPASSFSLGTLVLEETCLHIRNAVILRQSCCDEAKASSMEQIGGETETEMPSQPSSAPVKHQTCE